MARHGEVGKLAFVCAQLLCARSRHRLGLKRAAVQPQRFRICTDALRQHVIALLQRAQLVAQHQRKHAVAREVGHAGKRHIVDAEAVAQHLQFSGARVQQQPAHIFRIEAAEPASEAHRGAQHFHRIGRCADDAHLRLPRTSRQNRSSLALFQAFRRMLQLRIQHAGIHFIELLLQLEPQRAQLREGASLPLQHGDHHVHQLAGVHRRKEVAAEAVGQHKARVLLGDLQLQKLLVEGKQRLSAPAIERLHLRIHALRHHVACIGEVHIAAGLHREGCQAELDHELLHQHRHIVEGDGQRLMLDHGLVAGSEHLVHQLQILLAIPALFIDLQGRALLGGDARGGCHRAQRRLVLLQYARRSVIHLHAPLHLYCSINRRSSQASVCTRNPLKFRSLHPPPKQQFCHNLPKSILNQAAF